MSVAPTGTMSPTAAPSAVTVPEAGTGSSTSALSVCTCTTIWSRVTWSPTATRHCTSSASVIPSPRSGSRYGRTSGIEPSGIERGVERGDDASDVGPAPVLDQRRRGADVGAGDAPDRRLQRIERLLLQRGDHLGAESTGEWRLVHDDDASTSLGGAHDGVDVERRQRAQVDHADARAAPLAHEVGRGHR